MIYGVIILFSIAYLVGAYFISQMNRKELEEIRKRKVEIQRILNQQPKNK